MIHHLKDFDQYISEKSLTNLENAIALKEMGLKRKNKKIGKGVCLMIQ